MTNPASEISLKRVWNNVADRYRQGYCVSERGLQMHLAVFLEKHFSGRAVVVEPMWKLDGIYSIPDLVMAEGHCITDIFEIKYVPHACAVWKSDLDKLNQYRLSLEDRSVSLRIDPDSGCWSEEQFIVSERCSLHFVAVSSRDAEAVWPECLATYATKISINAPLWHWYGRVGDGSNDSWGVRQIIDSGRVE